MTTSRDNDRPPVSVIVPFGGKGPESRMVLRGLARLQLRAGDELLVVDNGDGSVAASASAATGALVVPAPERRSSYYARNVGAAWASNEWLLFMDADCKPVPSLLDRYFARPVPPRCGAIAGAILPAEPETLVARYAQSRGHLDQAAFRTRRPSFAATANLLVRAAAWAALGGFREVRSGGDVDFCWRLQAAGWSLELRDAAIVRHRHRERLWSLLQQQTRYGAGRAWLARNHRLLEPSPRPLRGALLSLVAAMLPALRREREATLFRLLDALVFGAHLVGSRLSNEPRAAQGRASRSASRPASSPRR